MTISKEHKQGFVTAIVLAIVIYLLFLRKGKSSTFVPNAPIPPPSTHPTRIGFGTASGAVQGGVANQVWTGNEWAQVYGEPMFGQEFGNMPFSDQLDILGF